MDLGLLCLYWARPEVAHPVRRMGEAALRGINVHKASENHHHGRPPPALDNAERAMWEQLKLWLGQRPPASHAELALIYDAEHDTARVCRTGETERDYLDVGPMSIPMRLDLAWAGPSDAARPVAVDIKTGSRSNTAPAESNVQIATQGLALARLTGARSAGVGLIFPLRTKSHYDPHQLDADALDAHAGVLHQRLRALPTAAPERGSHCWRCPIGPTRDEPATCPAWAREEAAE